MNERDVLQEIRQDLRLALATEKVLYLEGRSDVPIFLALLGIAPPPIVPDEGWVTQGVLVRGLNTDGRRRGSGNHAVHQRVQVASKHGYVGVRGLVDGDGDLYAELAACFDAPFAGQLHRWKAYCIENLLAQASWPPGWGPAPTWPDVLRKFLPYAALNRVVRHLQQRLTALGIRSFVQPQRGQPLRTVADFEEQLGADLEASRGDMDVIAMFREEVAVIEEALAAPDLLQAHALINGKWLVEVYAPEQARRAAEECRRAWIDHVARAGGHPEVRAWWERYLAL